MHAWKIRSERKVGEHVETGGLLFGERDDLLRVIWVNEVLGPPSDSKASETAFVCGTQGTAEASVEKSERSRGSLQFVGLWHTHPDSIPLPSGTDFAAARKLLRETGSHTNAVLFLI